MANAFGNEGLRASLELAGVNLDRFKMDGVVIKITGDNTCDVTMFRIPADGQRVVKEEAESFLKQERNLTAEVKFE